jgi:hypothetical protein
MGAIKWKNQGYHFERAVVNIFCFITVKLRATCFNRPGYILCETILMLLLIMPTDFCSETNDVGDVDSEYKGLWWAVQSMLLLGLWVLTWEGGVDFGGDA